MAKKGQIREEEIARAKQLRDTAKSVADLRKALSVILAAELDLDADRTADILGTYNVIMLMGYCRATHSITHSSIGVTLVHKLHCYDQQTLSFTITSKLVKAKLRMHFTEIGICGRWKLGQ